MVVGRLDRERFGRMVAAKVESGLDPVIALCAACVDALGVSGAGVMLLSAGHRVTCVGVSDATAEAVEQVEYMLGEGPCVDAGRRGVPVMEPDLAASDGRWPGFCEGAVAVGVSAAFGFPLFAEGASIGALNLYRDRPGALSDGQYADALIAAEVAASSVLQWQAQAPPRTLAWQLEEFPRHRVEVHQASGRISVQARVSVADALALLRSYAFANERLISDIASDVVAGRLRFD